MKKLYEPRLLEIRGITVRQIVIDQTEWVTLWGCVSVEQKKNKMNFMLEFDILNKLLRYNGEVGDEIQMLLVERLEGGVKGPQVLDLEAMFGMAAVLDCCPVKVYHPQQEVRPGQWQEDPKSLVVDEVILPGVKKQPADERTLYRRNFNKCIRLLVISYRLYLGYLELDFNQEEAQEKADLQDSVKFRMAYYAWKSISGISLN
ncbi:MAG TPA: hypothetical protein VNE41_10510 [Chitinophagaceae bacterium]|nr:hypothetical protein [Chitinophagaceae bacterium]